MRVIASTIIQTKHIFQLLPFSLKYWILNNSIIKQSGLKDPLMVKCSKIHITFISSSNYLPGEEKNKQNSSQRERYKNVLMNKMCNWWEDYISSLWSRLTVFPIYMNEMNEG